jgi:hypothetical protein
VDEAQNLDPTVLEQLRLLSNLETETDKLLQIILLGQPELRGLLERPDLRQLSQRISLRWHLESLDRKEASEYIQHRVRVAGGREGLFDPRGLDMIHELSGGIPRLINVLAHRALLVTYTKGQKRVTPAEVELAAVELEQCRIPLRTRSHNSLHGSCEQPPARQSRLLPVPSHSCWSHRWATTDARPQPSRARRARRGRRACTRTTRSTRRLARSRTAEKDRRKHDAGASEGAAKEGPASEMSGGAEVASATPPPSSKAQAPILRAPPKRSTSSPSGSCAQTTIRSRREQFRA